MVCHCGCGCVTYVFDSDYCEECLNYHVDKEEELNMDDYPTPVHDKGCIGYKWNKE